MIPEFIFETYPYFETIPDFSSCCVFRAYPGFETITGIYINVNFQVFTPYITKHDVLIRYNINKIENKNILFFYILKIITALRNQNINIFVLTIYIQLEMRETVGLKCLSTNQWYSIILLIKCGILDSRNNSEINLVFTI